MNEEQNKQKKSLVSYLIIFFVGCSLPRGA